LGTRPFYYITTYLPAEAMSGSGATRPLTIFNFLSILQFARIGE